MQQDYTLLHEWEVIQESIQFKAGSTGPTKGRVNAEAENRIFSCAAGPYGFII